MVDNSLVIALILVIVGIEIFARFIAPKPPKEKNEDRLSGFPYEVVRNFLSPAELNFYRILRGVVGTRAALCVKVGLGDVFWVNATDKRTFPGYRNKINRKHVDFLLCDPQTMRPVLGIELDDSSHQREDRQMRDAFVDGVFAAAGLPLLHIPVTRGYDAVELDARISAYIGRNAESLEVLPGVPTPPRPAPPVREDATVAQTAESPRCPKCGSAMILRVAKSGANAGRKFWGCSTYPNCTGMVSYSA